jgi:hypothetical protein
MKTIICIMPIIVFMLRPLSPTPLPPLRGDMMLQNSHRLANGLPDQPPTKEVGCMR